MLNPYASMGTSGTTSEAGAAGGGFLSSAGGAATIDLISGLLSGIFSGMGQSARDKRAMKMWREMTGERMRGLEEHVKPKAPYSEWYAGRAVPMADYLQNILSSTMQQRGLG